MTVPAACAGQPERYPVPPRADGRAPPRRGSPRRPPRGAAARRNAHAAARQRAHCSSRNAAPAPPPRELRGASGRAPEQAARDRCRPRRAQARTEGTEARATRCACLPRKARLARAARAAALRCLHAGPGARSGRRMASRRQEARGRALRSPWALQMHSPAALRHARLDAARECVPALPWTVLIYSIGGPGNAET